MQRRHELDALVGMPIAAQPRDRGFGLQERLCRERTKRNNETGLDEFDLFDQKGFTGGDFIRFGVAIVRRTAFNDVADIDIVASHLHTFCDDLSQ